MPQTSPLQFWSDRPFIVHTWSRLCVPYMYGHAAERAARVAREPVLQALLLELVSARQRHELGAPGRLEADGALGRGEHLAERWGAWGW